MKVHAFVFFYCEDDCLTRALSVLPLKWTSRCCRAPWLPFATLAGSRKTPHTRRKSACAFSWPSLLLLALLNQIRLKKWSKSAGVLKRSFINVEPPQTLILFLWSFREASFKMSAECLCESECDVCCLGWRFWSACWRICGCAFPALSLSPPGFWTSWWVMTEKPASS